MTDRTRQRVVTGPAFVPARARRAWSALLLASLPPLAGCYSTQPVSAAPAPGATVLLDLNDQGRIALGDRIGPSAARVEGIVQSGNDTAYVLRISSVRYLNGQSNEWSGEPFVLPARLVSGARVKEFSRARTTAIGVGIAAILATVFAKTSFFGLGGGTQDPVAKPGGQT